jgi:hypothetical protein
VVGCLHTLLTAQLAKPFQPLPEGTTTPPMKELWTCVARKGCLGPVSL